MHQNYVLTYYYVVLTGGQNVTCEFYFCGGGCHDWVRSTTFASERAFDCNTAVKFE